MGAKTVTAVDEFWTAARSGPPTAPMAATSDVRLAAVATERRVELVVAAGNWVVLVALGAASEEPSSSSSRTRRGEEKRNEGDIISATVWGRV